ncbi:hypothetical protein PIB30_074603 [Stylosanthes scabra]|uniref:Uncharacterized protein n=1 Tax=Stylosanthes scabra TaxID=79078 RepID=A0ABU6TPB2_9FABA|nr:hypothetical protein [Stylosanthes scabra]
MELGVISPHPFSGGLQSLIEKLNHHLHSSCLNRGSTLAGGRTLCSCHILQLSVQISPSLNSDIIAVVHAKANEVVPIVVSSLSQSCVQNPCCPYLVIVLR